MFELLFWIWQQRPVTSGGWVNGQPPAVSLPGACGCWDQATRQDWSSPRAAMVGPPLSQPQMPDAPQRPHPRRDSGKEGYCVHLELQTSMEEPTVDKI